MVPTEPTPPGSINGNADPNSRPPRHSPASDPPIFDIEIAARKVEPVVIECDAQSAREIPWAATEIDWIDSTSVW